MRAEVKTLLDRPEVSVYRRDTEAAEEISFEIESNL
jgi:hypothetical protein